MTPPLHWPAEAIWEAVSPRLPDFSVEILAQVDSTNTELMRRARAGRTEAVLLVAERQTAGRGRLGKPWYSEPGPASAAALAPAPATAPGPVGGSPAALTFSLGLPLAPRDWSGLSLVVGLVVARALDPRILLKWPNDLWVHDRKLGGILIETAGLEGLQGVTPTASAALPDRNPARYLVVGIGLNLRLPSAEGLSVPPAALCDLQPDAQAGRVLAAVVPPVIAALQGFEDAGFAPWASLYAERDLLAGRAVVLSDGTAGTAGGVDAGGALLVHTGQGLRKVTSAEVSVRPSAGPRF